MQCPTLRRLVRLAVISVTFVTLLALPVRADWNPGDPHKMHYPQLPDLTPTGLDVLATRQPVGNFFKLVADDWACSETGPVRDIHLWGSWLNDLLPRDGTGAPDPSAVAFKLSIHADIPVGPNTPYSRPGEQLWSRIFEPGAFKVRLYSELPAGTPGEGFFDPNIPEIIGHDRIIWQYNFDPIADPFIQELGKIYWLDVQALPASADAFFGWKTTNPLITPHFLDDAVFGDTTSFAGPLIVPPGWRELIYPVGHPFAGQSIDQAFVITPEPASVLVALGAAVLLACARRH